LNQKVDCNVEFAHVKATDLDNELSKEHIRSCQKLLVLLEQLNQESVSWCTVVLVDDYNFNLEGERSPKRPFFEWLEKQGCEIDYVAWERQLNCAIPDFLDSLEPYRRDRIDNYIRKNKGKIPCSLHVAIWNLVRLGALPVPEDLLQPVGNKRKPFAGETIITILPNTLQHYEDEGQNILLDSTYSNYVRRLNHIYFESPNDNGTNYR